MEFKYNMHIYIEIYTKKNSLPNPTPHPLPGMQASCTLYEE